MVPLQLSSGVRQSELASAPDRVPLHQPAPAMFRFLVVLLASLPGALDGQGLSGRWQGTLVTGARQERLVLDFKARADGAMTVALYNLDQGGFAAPSAAFTAVVRDREVVAQFARGTLSAVMAQGARALEGSWQPNSGASQKVTFVRPMATEAWVDSAKHTVRFIAVGGGVSLEVLDFGGSGRPIVLLTGAGNNAHVFDEFGPTLSQHYRVYAVTRRGFAPSTIISEGFRADSLANDVLAVLDSLRLRRPVLVGHSIAGQELSAIGGRHADRVAGLAYLDAGYPYALYDPTLNNATYVMPDAIRNLELAFDRWAPLSFAERAAVLRELADSTFPVLQRDMRQWADQLERNPNATARPMAVPRDPVASALFLGAQRHRSVAGPVLALFAAPRQLAPAVAADPVASARADSVSLASALPQIQAFERGVPQARVVRIPHAHHYIFRSHPQEVLRELRAFIDALPVER